jgi:hypothetical protein
VNRIWNASNAVRGSVGNLVGKRLLKDQEGDGNSINVGTNQIERLCGR